MTAKARPVLLVVDDLPGNLDVLLEVLGDTYEVQAALDGDSALELALAFPPDLILLDIMMPKMDGYEVLGCLKADPRTAGIPVIFVTAMGEEADELKGFEAGAVDYITKPVSPPLVRARVATHLALFRAGQALARQNQILEENIRLREEVEHISRHDLKTPLAKIISLAGLLGRDSEVPDRIREGLGVIEQAGFTMLNMINNSLDLVKMENQTYTPSWEPVPLHEVVRRVASDLEPECRPKGCGIATSVSGSLPDAEAWVTGEYLLCYAMLANLMKNAVEASPEGEDIHVRLCCSPGTVEIQVCNKGMVPESIRETFFDKYTTAGKPGGTGLGTYSARLMAQTLGGHIRMTTGQDQGTCVRITLPEAAPKSPATRVAPGLPDRFAKSRLLVVDDDPDNLAILAALLDHPCLTLDQAANGRDALEMWQKNRYDLVLMDVEMPVMDGVEAVRQIRARDPDRGMPVYALSAHDQSLAKGFMDAGFTGVLTKPVTREKLFSVLGCHLAGEPAAQDNGLGSGQIPGTRVLVDRDLADILPQFMANKAGQLDQLKTLVEDSDYPGIRQTAHKLKGGFNMYGIAVLGDICASLEQAAVQEDPVRVRQLSDRLCDVFERLDIRTA